MVLRAPVLSRDDFAALGGADAAQVEQRFAPWIAKLHDFLNALPCIASVQGVRFGRSTSVQTFQLRNVHYDAEHWYTFHRGGRSEAQFNVGMFPGHLRFGIGFQPTRASRGDPDAVRLAQRRFAKALRGVPGGPKRFCAANRLRVEVPNPGGGVLTMKVRHFLRPKSRNAESWIFVGRMLREDEESLYTDADAFSAELERVFATLWPLWRATR
jgi:hypothetical protein